MFTKQILKILRSIRCNCKHFKNCANSPLFKQLLLIIHVELATFTKVYDHFQGNLYLMITKRSIVVHYYVQILFNSVHIIYAVPDDELIDSKHVEIRRV
jgi:hypothetical protein